MTELLPWSPLIGGVAIAVVSGLFLLWKTRQEGQSKRDPTWGELVAENRKQREEFDDFREKTDTRLNALDRKLDATARVLTALAEQWHGDPPLLDPADIDALGTTLPAKFRPRRIHRMKEKPA